MKLSAVPAILLCLTMTVPAMAQSATRSGAALFGSRSSSPDDQPAPPPVEEKKPTAAQQVYIDHLTELGLDPKVDEDGDIHYVDEGIDCFIIIDNEDEQFFRLVAPGIVKLGLFDNIGATDDIEVVCRSVKCAKGMIVDNHVWISVESFFETREDFAKVFDRCRGSLALGVETFLEIYEPVRKEKD